MKFGLFTCGYQRHPLEKAFADAAAFGYDYIELWGGRPHAFAPDLLRRDARKVRALVEKYRMPVMVYTPEHNGYPFNYMAGDDYQWEDAMDYLETCLKAANAIGAEYTLVSMGHSGFLPPTQRQERLRRSLQRLLETAEREDQKILLETLTPMESDTCTDLASYVSLLDSLPHERLLAMCDVVVPFVQGEDPADYVKKLGDRCCHLHFVDSDGVSESHLIPGDGVMPLRSTIRKMRRAGFGGSATIELVTNYIDDPSAAAYKALMRAKEMT